MSASYYVRIQGRIMGPFETHQLISMRDRGQLKQYHEISVDQASWYPAGNFPELFPSGGGNSNPVRNSSPSQWTAPVGGGTPPPPADATPRRNRPLDEEYDDRPRRSQYDDYDAPPRRGGFPWLIVISVLIILGGGATLVILLTTGKDGSGSGDTISNLDEKKLSKAIGHVICGAEIIQPDGTLIEIPTTSGSSFMISPMGHLMTNKHVIESVQKQLRSPQLKRKNEESDRIIRPRVWVFLEAKKYQAEILHVSDEFDMAILKIDETTPNYFRLSNSTEFSRNIEVVACGFPGAAEGTVSFEEEVKKKVTEKVLHEKVEKYYNQRDFIFSSVKGPISRVFAEETGRNWIQHAANIIHGYSGGPLLTEDGTVVGINTRVADANIGKNFQIAPGIGYALTMPQMRKEIDRIVKDVNWK